MKILAVKNFLASIFSLLLFACATDTSTMTEAERGIAYEQFKEVNKLVSINRITSFDFYSWTALGDQHMIINSRFNKPYLITLQRNCFDLSFANTIIIHRNGSSLHVKSDAISVMEPISVKCFIKSIHPLTNEQDNAIRKIGYANKEADEEHIVDK